MIKLPFSLKAIPPKFSPDEELLDKQQILLKYKISERTLQRWRTGKLIPFIKIKGKFYYREKDVLRLIANHHVEKEDAEFNPAHAALKVLRSYFLAVIIIVVISIKLLPLIVHSWKTKTVTEQALMSMGITALVVILLFNGTKIVLKKRHERALRRDAEREKNGSKERKE